MEREDKNIPVLYGSKKECCGCGACINACPCKAITMVEDEYGFRYPQIDELLCLRCGKCKHVCAFQNSVLNHEPLETYAAVAKNEALRKKSSSGGIFAAVAQQIFEQGGIVFGAAMQDDFTVKHVGIENVDSLALLQGSKYTHSDTNSVYSEIQDWLKRDRLVLFSGTPCQVDGLYGFLGKQYDKLLTIDIICHGVPSNRMFKEYVDTLGNNVSRFLFRDKSMGWGINGSAIVDGKRKTIWQSSSSYMHFFIKGWIYRENCYSCKYACKHRTADITLGDYWGIEKQHPNYLNNEDWDEAKGISVIITNTEKGLKLIQASADVLDIKLSEYEKAAIGNHQLKQPCNPGKRNEVFTEYSREGWNGVEKYYKQNIGWHFYSSQVKALIPKRLKRLLKSKR